MKDRYIRNIPALSEEECALLQSKHVCVVGCGGLGGSIIDQLARIGVGTITVVDDDVFDVTNLNRQLLSSEPVIGRSKTQVALEHVGQINSEVVVHAIQTRFTEENGAHLLETCDVVIDALDNIEGRKILADACANKNIKMVHGAISGWFAQVAVIEPGSGVLDTLYPAHIDTLTSQGNLAFVAGTCASIQVAEAIKVLCGRESTLSGKMLVMNLDDMEFTTIEL